MQTRMINAPEVAPPGSGYCHAIEVSGASRLLFTSGQVPVRPDGTVPETFREQCEVAWANLEGQLKAAGMTFDNIVKVTTFLSSREHRAENKAVRLEVLGDRTPTVTVQIIGIFDEAWLVELEVIAAA